MVNGVVHCGKFSSMWFVAVMRVYTGLGLLDGIRGWGCVSVYASIAVGAGLVYETLLTAANGEETFGKEMKF